MDVELILEQVSMFYIAFTYALGNFVTNVIQRNLVNLKLRRYYIEHYSYLTVKYEVERKTIIKWYENFIV